MVIAGLSMNVFLAAQYDGMMVRKIKWPTMFMLCLIFYVFECLSMLGGYELTKIDFFRNSSSGDLKKFCYFCASVLFLLIAFYMLYKAFREKDIQEHVGEVSVKRTIFEVLVVAVFAFIAGIGWGFIGHNIFMAAGVLAMATVLAVLLGAFYGYTEGCRNRRGLFAAGGACLLFVGVEIIVRYL